MARRNPHRVPPALAIAALAASALGASSAASAPAGDVSYVTVPHATSNLVSGPDGNLWFLDTTNDRVGRMAPGGAITYIDMPSAGPGLTGLAVGPDGNLWTIEADLDKLARITPQGAVEEGPLVPTNSGSFRGIVPGPDGNLWAGSTALGQDNGFIRIDPITRGALYVVLPAGSPITHMTPGPGESIYYSENLGTSVRRLRMDGTDAAVPGSAQAGGIAAGPDNRLWFTELSPPGAARVHAFDPPTGADSTFATESGTGAGAITAGADGGMWYSQFDATPPSIARVSTGGTGAVAYASGLPAVDYIDSMTPAADGSTWFAGGDLGVFNSSVIGRIGTGVDRVARASMSGSSRVGESHSCSATVEAAGMGAESARRYSWLLDGVPVAGATSSTYAPAASAVGARLACRVTLTFAPSLVQMGFTSDPVVLVAPPAAAGGGQGGTSTPASAPRTLRASWKVSGRRVTARFRPVPGANRYLLRATRAKARARVARCRVVSARRTAKARPVRTVTCTIRLPKGRWTVTAQARRGTTVLAQARRVVRAR